MRNLSKIKKNGLRIKFFSLIKLFSFLFFSIFTPFLFLSALDKLLQGFFVLLTYLLSHLISICFFSSRFLFYFIYWRKNKENTIMKDGVTKVWRKIVNYIKTENEMFSSWLVCVCASEDEWIGMKMKYEAKWNKHC